MNINKNQLLEKYGKSLLVNENLSKYSWFKLGGPAELFFRPKDREQLINFLKEVRIENNYINVLGAGSNTLIRDSGVNGLVIKLGSSFSDIKLLEKDTIEVGASTLDRKISDFASNNNISGLEFLSCIPGSIGGGIIMNSGCYGSDISNILESIRVIDLNGNEKTIKNSEINFFYRGSDIPKNYIIVSAVLKGKISNKEIVQKKQQELIQKKKDSQPSKVKTGGSTFKNNKEKKAWKLIKESGCDKYSVGDAKISEKHSNFFINSGQAKASDIEKLINKVKKDVKDKTGEKLELEIKIIGNAE